MILNQREPFSEDIEFLDGIIDSVSSTDIEECDKALIAGGVHRINQGIFSVEENREGAFKKVSDGYYLLEQVSDKVYENLNKILGRGSLALSQWRRLCNSSPGEISQEDLESIVLSYNSLLKKILIEFDI